jgi:hypothetical protein
MNHLRPRLVGWQRASAPQSGDGALGTPLTNLFRSMLDRMGVPVDQFGDSNGRLMELSDL